jgi:hypothetical protein
LLLLAPGVSARTPEPKKPSKEEPPPEPPPASTAPPTDDHALIAVVEKNKIDMKLCYQRVLRHEPSLRLKTVTRLRIGSDGKVTVVSFADPSLHREELGQCLSEAIRRWEFPTASAEYGFEFPIVMMRD